MFIILSSGGKNPLSDSHKHNIGGTKWGKVLHKWDTKPSKGIVWVTDRVSVMTKFRISYIPNRYNDTPIRKLTVCIYVKIGID